MQPEWNPDFLKIQSVILTTGSLESSPITISTEVWSFFTITPWSIDYRKFLDKGKTERECVKEIIKMAEKAGYKDLNKIITMDFVLHPVLANQYELLKYSCPVPLMIYQS